MADARFARARSWEEVLAIHRRFVHDYNVQRHWAHESREDGYHSPVEVLGGQTGTMYPPSVLDRILFATRYTRHLDRNGYLRFQNWKLYGERGLAKAPVTVWIYEGSLKVEHQAVTISQYSVELQDDQKHLREVSNPRLVETPFRSPQLRLFDLGPDEWLLYWRTPDVAPPRRRQRVAGLVQPLLFDLPRAEKVAGGDEIGSLTSPRPQLHVIHRSTADQETEE